MTTENTQIETPAVDTTGTPKPPAGNPTPETPAVDELIPKSKYNEKKAEAERLQRRLNELEAKEQETLTKAQEAEAEKLKAQGEFEQLYQQEQARAKEFEPYKARYEALAKVQAAQIEAAIKDWPNEVKAFDPGPDNLEARQAWLEKSKPLVEKLRTTAAPGARPNQPTPQGRGVPGTPLVSAKRF